MTTTAIPSYTNPPLSEVACGVQFGALALQTRHVGQFWTEIANEYPLTQDQPPIPDVGDPAISVLSIPPLRRVFMATASTEYLVQIQEARFHHNWRKLSPDVRYPRFDTVFERFLQVWGRFSDFVKGQSLGEPKPTRYELTYVNEFDSLGSLSVEQAVKLFNWRHIGAEFLPEPQATNIAWSFLLPQEKGVLNVSTNRFTRPDGRLAVLLTLACSGVAAPQKYSLNDWFGTAHEWIVRGFTDLTTSEAHRVWQREV